MIKKYILALALISFSCLTYAAKLPGSGYSGPYKFSDGLDDYGMHDPYMYEDWDNISSSVQFKVRGAADAATIVAINNECNSNLSAYVCQTCVTGAVNDYNSDAACSTIISNYESCLSTAANPDGSCSDLGDNPLPIGNTLFLLLFAPLYAAFALWRKKRLTIING